MMNTHTFALSTVSAALLASGVALAGGEGWTHDFAAAKQQAANENKSLLMDFTGSDWCPPCIAMRKNVFTKKEFIEAASKNFILVELDFPKKDKELAEKNQPHAEKYQIEGFPTVILLDSEGKEFTRFFASQFPNVEAFLKHLDQSLEKKDMD